MRALIEADAEVDGTYRGASTALFEAARSLRLPPLRALASAGIGL